MNNNNNMGLMLNVRGEVARHRNKLATQCPVNDAKLPTNYWDRTYEIFAEFDDGDKISTENGENNVER